MLLPHFFYKWNVFKKRKTSLEACFFLHDFYVLTNSLKYSDNWKLYLKPMWWEQNYRAFGTYINNRQMLYKKPAKMASNSKQNKQKNTEHGKMKN